MSTFPIFTPPPADQQGDVPLPESLATFWERDRLGRIRRRPAGGTRASETFTL